MYLYVYINKIFKQTLINKILLFFSKRINLSINYNLTDLIRNLKIINKIIIEINNCYIKI